MCTLRPKFKTNGNSAGTFVENSGKSTNVCFKKYIENVKRIKNRRNISIPKSGCCRNFKFPKLVSKKKVLLTINYY